MITEEFLRENAEYIEQVFNDYLGDLNGTKFTLCEENEPSLDKLCCMFEIDDSMDSCTNEQILEMYVIPSVSAVAREIGRQSVIRYAKPTVEPEMVGEGYVVFNGLIPFRIIIYERRVLVEAAVDSG